METLTLNDGTVLENSSAIEDENTLFVYTRNEYDMKFVFDALYDSGNISTITAVSPGVEEVFTGYSRLVAVTDEGHGRVSAVLKKN